MPKSNFALFVCSNFSREIESVVKDIPDIDVHLHYLNYKHECFPLKEKEIASIKNVAEKSSKVLIIGGCCFSSFKLDKKSNIIYIKTDNCFSILCSNKIIDKYISERAYIVTPKWLHSWEKHLNEWGVDNENSHIIFKDNFKKVILLDTGVFEDSLNDLVAFSEFVSLPYEVKSVGLDYLRLFIENQLNKLQSSWKIETVNSQYKTLQSRYSELGLYNDMMLQLTKITDEKQIILKICEIFEMFTAAGTIIYIPDHGISSDNIIFKKSEGYSLSGIGERWQNNSDQHIVSKSDSGFNVFFIAGNESIGVLLIDDIPLTEYMDHYLSIANAIVDLCALAISNAQKFSQIEQKNKEQSLLNRVLKLFLSSDDETDEIHNILSYLKEYTGIEAVGIRLKSKNSTSYYDSLGLNNDFIQEDNTECDKSGCKSDPSFLQCLCGAVLKLDYDYSLPYCTEHGSLWIGNSESLENLDNIFLDIDHKPKCITLGYNTIVLMPLFDDKETYGLLQFLDKRKNFFCLEDIEFLEKIGNSIGIALRKKNMREELHKARINAESANKAKSEFLANMSHEIRTPLNAIIGFSHLIENLKLEEKQLKYFNSINSAGHSLLTIIDDILDLSKIEAGKIEMRYSYFDIRVLLKEIETIFQIKLANKKLDFLLFIDQDMPVSLYLDEVRLRQILLNIVGNAIKFTEEGFIKISVHILSFSEDKKRLDLSIEIEDTGIGIPKKDYKRIFEAFKQQSSQDIRIYGGTGLGLAIVSRLISQMNGNISVESKVGSGSKFKIKICDAEIGTNENNPETLEKINASNLQFNYQKVLIVDDIQSNREILIELMRNMNLITYEAVNGQDGLKKVDEFKPDLIFLDFRMPVMDGLQMSDKLKESKNYCDIPIIGMTASVSERFDVLKSKHDFLEILRKPVSIDKVLILLTQLFENYGQTELEENIEHNSNKKDLSSPIENLELPKNVAMQIINHFELNKTKLAGALILSDVKKYSEELSIICHENNTHYFDNYIEKLKSAADNYELDDIYALVDDFKEKMLIM